MVLFLSVSFAMPISVPAPQGSSKIKAVFLDRDGTVIMDADYLSRIDQIQLIPELLPVWTVLSKVGYKLFIVSNQSGVARGMFDEARVQEVNTHLLKILADRGIIIEKCFYCPHHPTAGRNPLYTKECTCRKPYPGMLQQAAEGFPIDLSQSIMIGDKECDVQAGKAAGCRSFLVQSIAKDPAGWLKEISSVELGLRS